MKYDDKTLREALRLYAVTDRCWTGGEGLPGQVEAALKGGATLIQLREKDLPDDAFLEEAIRIGEICRRYQVPLVINDNVEVAIQSNADGVHVGQDDMAASDVRARIGEDKILGVSAHTLEEALLARDAGADYLGLGAVFSTTTKTDVDEMPAEVLRQITEGSGLPTVAIGGINLGNMDRLKDSGVDGIAVVSAIFGAPDVEAASRALREEADAFFGDKDPA